MNLMEIISAARSSGNPQAFLQAQAQNNPVIARAMQMTAGKNPQEVMQVANNLAREQGIDLNTFRQKLGL